MGVSFKVSKTGTRFHPKPVIPPEPALDEVSENSKEGSVIVSKNDSSTRKLEVIIYTWISLVDWQQVVVSEVKAKRKGRK